MFDQGTATIRDLSQGGARITDLTLSQGKLPAAAFSIELRPRTKSLESTEMKGRLVRFEAPPSFGFGVTFTEMDSVAQRKLRRFVEADA